MRNSQEQSHPPLERHSDETLCALAASGNREAEEVLVARYNRLVRTCARPFFLIGGDSEDLTQEGMVGLIKAVREYDAAKEASFRTFAEICIRSRLYSVLRAAARDKHSPLNQSVPLDTPFLDSNSFTSGTSHLAQRNPEDFLIDREHTAALLAGVRKQLSEFEAKILGVLFGRSFMQGNCRDGRQAPKVRGQRRAAHSAQGSAAASIRRSQRKLSAYIFFFSKRG